MVCDISRLRSIPTCILHSIRQGLQRPSRAVCCCMWQKEMHIHACSPPIASFYTTSAEPRTQLHGAAGLRKGEEVEGSRRLKGHLHCAHHSSPPTIAFRHQRISLTFAPAILLSRQPPVKPSDHGHQAATALSSGEETSRRGGEAPVKTAPH